MLTFGGDHYITLPLLRAYKKYFGKIALIHFDAHTDTYSSETIFDHGTIFSTALKEKLIDPICSIQIGIRTAFNRSIAFKVLDAQYVNDCNIDDILIHIKNTVKNLPVYLTFDIDCLDPVYAPGTGTPVIGGLTSDKTLRIIRRLRHINIVGMDIVEVAPFMIMLI